MLKFSEFLQEHVLSIGINPDHEKYREQYRNQIHDIIRNSYQTIGGYKGIQSGTQEESDAIHNDISKSMVKLVIRNGKVTAVNLYSPKFGRKSIASATDGTQQGKKDFLKNKLEDHTQERAWGEVSGAVEHISKKLGIPNVPANQAADLLGKDVDIDPNSEYHYNRKIGNKVYTKTIVGHPKK